MGSSGNGEAKPAGQGQPSARSGSSAGGDEEEVAGGENIGLPGRSAGGGGSDSADGDDLYIIPMPGVKFKDSDDND